MWFKLQNISQIFLNSVICFGLIKYLVSVSTEKQVLYAIGASLIMMYSCVCVCVLTDWSSSQDSDGEKSEDNLVVDVSNEVSALS